ncbi:MAG: enoyl-CoA hydratase [Acidimicrobiia bacterium]|nr:enoyl-CoA hydratase [Acidimicrobiia bacterium]
MVGNGSDSDVVAVEVGDDGVVLVTLRRPPANALGEAMIAGLGSACDRAEAVGAGAMVVRSAVAGFFAAGADLHLLDGLDRDRFVAYLGRLRAVLDRIAAAPWVSVAAIEGHALGGGLEVAMACTLRVASDRSRLGVPEVKLGLLPGAEGTQRLPRLVGRGPALDLLLTGRSAGGEEAYRIGLVDRLVPEGRADAEARAWAAAFAAGPRQAHAAIIRCVDAARDLPLEDGVEVERREIVALFDTADAGEGIRAFLEKRPPRFGS